MSKSSLRAIYLLALLGAVLAFWAVVWIAPWQWETYCIEADDPLTGRTAGCYSKPEMLLGTNRPARLPDLKLPLSIGFAVLGLGLVGVAIESVRTSYKR